VRYAENTDTKKALWLAFIISSYAKRNNIDRRAAVRLMSENGGLNFIDEHYDAEHLLSFEDVVDDIESLEKRNSNTKN
jgi:hypothetical protein